MRTLRKDRRWVESKLNVIKQTYCKPLLILCVLYYFLTLILLNILDQNTSFHHEFDGMLHKNMFTSFTALYIWLHTLSIGMLLKSRVNKCSCLLNLQADKPQVKIEWPEGFPWNGNLCLQSCRNHIAFDGRVSLVQKWWNKDIEYLYNSSSITK